MTFSYPFYDTNSPYYESNKLWSALELSTAGGFTLGGNGFWHGGVHFESGAGVTESRAIRAIADGEVIAYRLNKEYLKKDAETQGTTLFEYSTGFVLIKHSYQSLFGVDAQGVQTQDRNKLEFYSLYMHVKPFNVYEEDELTALSYCEGEAQYKVTANATDGGDGGLNMRPTPNGNPELTQLPVGTRVKIGQTQGSWGKVSEIVSGYNDYSGDLGWIYLNNNETEKISIPNQFDDVRNLVSSLENKVKAGQKIGYMGKYDAPASATNGKKQLHLEVFTTATQAEIVAFLSNNANVNLPESHDLYKIEQNAPFASMQQEPATEGSPMPTPIFTESTETHFQNVLVNSRTLEKKLKTDVSGNTWLPLSATTHTTDNNKESLASEGWVQVTGADPSNWPGFDNPPLDGVADGVGFYKMDEPSTLMTTLIKRVEPSYISGAETPRTRQTYALALKQVIAKDAVARSIIKHKVEWSSAYTTDLMTVVTSEELIPDNEKRTRFQERKDELDFWEEVTGMGTNEAYYFHPLAFIDNMMRMEAYYEAVIHVTSEIKTAIVLNGSVATPAPDTGGYNGLENGYTLDGNIYSKKKDNNYSYYPTYKAYLYRGIGTEAKAKMEQDIASGNHLLAESDVLELARHVRSNNSNYNYSGPVPPTDGNTFYEVKFRFANKPPEEALRRSYRYRISTPSELYPTAFPDVAAAAEVVQAGAVILANAPVHTQSRGNVSFDPWKSTGLIGCLGVRNGSGENVYTPASMSKPAKYSYTVLYLEEKIPELQGVYGRLHSSYIGASSNVLPNDAPDIPVVTSYDRHTRVWVKIDPLEDMTHILNGGN